MVIKKDLTVHRESNLKTALTFNHKPVLFRDFHMSVICWMNLGELVNGPLTL